ncbi:MAG: tyrosine-type recombinase/integrase, partial [Mesorhizobium sp.]
RTDRQIRSRNCPGFSEIAVRELLKSLSGVYWNPCPGITETRKEIAGLRWSEVRADEGLLVLSDSKTGKSARPIGAAAIALLKSIKKADNSDFVFPAERGEGSYQGTKGVWAKVIKKAQLPGVNAHTLRHTIGSTATSSGEALALTGAILGHSNPRSTAIYAHVQTDPSRQAAERVSAKIAAALAGKPENGQTPEHAAEEIDAIVRALVERLTQQGVDANEIGALVGRLVEGSSSQPDKAAA